MVKRHKDDLERHLVESEETNVLLYPKDADFHMRQGRSRPQPAETNLPESPVTSTDREACLEQKNRRVCYYDMVLTSADTIHIAIQGQRYDILRYHRHDHVLSFL